MKPQPKKAPKPSDERGDFRSMYSVLFDSPEYEELSLAASHLLVTVKHSLGPAGIGVLEVATLQRRAKLTDAEFEPAKVELIKGQWIYVEHRVWWLRNGLRFEPSMVSSNENHVRGIQRFLNGLPKLAIANRFAAYYRRLGWDLAEPFPNLNGNGIGMGSVTHRDPIEIPFPRGMAMGTHPDPIAITEPLTLTEPLTEPLTESDSETESESDARAPEGVASLEQLNPTDDHRTRAAELKLDLDHELRRWKLHRQANGIDPADPVADFGLWLERAPGFNGSGSREPTPLPGSALWNREPDANGITKRHEAVQSEPEAPFDPAAVKAGLDLVAQAVGAVRRVPGDGPAPVIADPDVIARREENRKQLRAQAQSLKAAEADPVVRRPVKS